MDSERLSYKINNQGYIIFLDGKPWIEQQDYIPYPMPTLDESAQQHIQILINESNQPIESTLSLEDQVQEIREVLDILLGEDE